MNDNLNMMKICVLLLLIAITVSLPMVKRLQPNEAFCFNDDIPQHTLVKVKITVDSPIQLEIYSSNKILKNIQLHGQTVQSWTTQNYGIYKVCFKNYQNQVGFLKYDFAVGQRANDFTSSYEGKDYLKSLENQANIAAYFAQQIQRQNNQGLGILMNQNLSANSYSCVYMLSTFFVGISIALTYIQFKMVRKHLHNRKYL